MFRSFSRPFSNFESQMTRPFNKSGHASYTTVFTFMAAKLTPAGHYIYSMQPSYMVTGLGMCDRTVNCQRHSKYL